MSQQQTPSPPRKVDVSWPQVVASALAAVSSAVLLSTVGVAGTLIGAAVGSVIATVGTAFYRYSLEASRARVAAAQNAALTRVARARAQAHVARGAGLDDTYAQRRLAQAEDELDDAEHDLDQAGTANEERPSWRETLAGLPWKRVALAATGVFIAAMVAILAFELVTGRAVSTYTGGTSGSDRTTLSGLTGGGGSPSQDKTPNDQKTGTGGGQSSAPSAQPTQQSTSSGGSTPTPSATPSQEPTQPQETPTPSPSSAPTTGAPGPVTSSP